VRNQRQSHPFFMAPARSYGVIFMRDAKGATKARQHKNPKLPTLLPLSDGALRLISREEVESRVQTSFTNIWKMMREGRFPLPRKVNGRTFWLEPEIDAWMKSLPVAKYKSGAA
jgi:predicted DNA-binding transcriptional regulator AlpA